MVDAGRNLRRESEMGEYEISRDGENVAGENCTEGICSGTVD